MFGRYINRNFSNKISLALLVLTLLTIPVSVFYVLDPKDFRLSKASHDTPITPPVTNPNNPKPGDANQDGKVDGLDYVIWLLNYNKQVASGTKGDYDGNGFVDGLDYVIWLSNYTF